MKKVLICFSLLAPLFLFSQQPEQNLPRADFMDHTLKGTVAQPGGGIIIHQSPEIHMLSIRFKQEHSHAKRKGFKVQIYLGERPKAEEVLRVFSAAYPEVPAGIDYQPPNYKVRVGNFRTQNEAENFLREIKPIYSGAYVVPDNINLPGL